MQIIIGFVFCLLLGLSIRGQGWTALFWFPAGFAFALLASAQMLLPLMLGLPRAISLVARGQMRPAVFGAIILTPAVWFVLLNVAAFLIGWFWPTAAHRLYDNEALNKSLWLGTIAIVLSPLSRKSRADFREDFDQAYGRFFTEDGHEVVPVPEEEESELTR